MKIYKRMLLFSLTVLLMGCGNAKSGEVTSARYPAAETVADQSAEDTETGESELFIVMKIDQDQQTISLARPGDNSIMQYEYTEGMQILDKYGDYTSLSALKSGRVVKLTQFNSQQQLTGIQISDEAWYQTKITRYAIDEDAGMMTIGQTKYAIDENLRVFSGSSEIALNQVGTSDTLAVQGEGKQIFSIRVTKGHGTIALKNTKLFEGGWINLGNRIYSKITPQMTMVVPEGTYQLTVANDGYGDTGSIKVKRGHVTEVDLNDYKGEGPQYCEVTFVVGVEDAVLTVDGSKISTKKPVKLKYGIHTLTVVASGYDTWSRKLVIHSPEAVISSGDSELSVTSADDTSADTESTTNSTTSQNSTKSDTDTSKTNTDYLDTISDLLSSLNNSSSSDSSDD